ncbi:MAG TPA: hypothetical protein VN685_06285 [Rhizomicrobium sp.]|jgi:hypothetical protein|nr:hypothetical protein [Rhizomicrobium sp.]
MGFPIFVTRVKVGKGRDVILISAESPAGVSGKSEVESVEAMRFVVSLSTFAEITELFVRTLKTIDPALLKAVARPGIAAQLQAGDLGSDRAEGALPSHHKH